mmetsp:Transcript_46504/g.131481  ORF Transcript_46504/g.131481 Transcript_46504/m.131481 type:complete len:97 (-) Transcript_46504:42-332(-)|eukprot:CAMPEP_0179325112 /NCGR_PEP_ID=MMETSP0797-20121207/60683_1 /TAXON_ID=47934 /ORGANISM="Dinophysis acuminata, Strain DAEP01" /LENGTH=96 /DNA_ID=CAMNT_0021037205 /DNA_START=154 /DNA_END=444 /DNA_ORIENTATION=+
MDKLAANADYGDQAKFLMINIDKGATAEATSAFMDKNNVTVSTGATGVCHDFFKQTAFPHKALVNRDGVCVANFRFRAKGGEKGERVGTPEDFALL